MIRHRFIVRGLDDFRIFAAIPVETKVLTWEKWVRPPDWEGLDELEKYAQSATTEAIPLFERCADSAELLTKTAKLRPTEAADEFFEDTAWRSQYARDVAQRFSGVAENFQEHRAWRAHALETLDAQQRYAGFVVDVNGLVVAVKDKQMDELIAGGPQAAENLRMWKMVAAERIWKDHGALNRAGLDMFQSMVEIADLMRDLKNYVLSRAEALLSSDPLPDTECPPGVPFAAYTVEFKDAVFSVVEGKAWVSSRPLPPVSVEEEAKLRRQAVREINALQAEADAAGEFKERRVLADFGDHRRALRDNPAPPTDEEKRVVEIVTQMLVERGLNPKAPERIPVTEVDPGHANHVREAETRDIRDGRAPKVRTIKFNVTPPRYLREAVERIHASPGKHKKAHWVIGHWRNQPYGAGRHEHRRTWIKPHIRGLGEAGAVVVRVAAADETVATLPDQPTPPGGQA